MVDVPPRLPTIHPEARLLEQLHNQLRTFSRGDAYQLGEALQRYQADGLSSEQWSLLWRVTRLYAELDAACVEAARALRVCP
jgi:hypothetical protein